MKYDLKSTFVFLNLISRYYQIIYGIATVLILWLGYYINCMLYKHCLLYCSLQAAELDIKGTEMTAEALNQVQLGHLRIYHAACLMADAVPEVMYHRTPSGRSHG